MRASMGAWHRQPTSLPHVRNDVAWAQASIQILTATSGTVKLASRGDPWSVLFSLFGKIERLQVSPRETSFTVPRGKTVNICFITPHT